jgi:hypothetical protein
MTAWGPIAAPATALLFGIVVFVLPYRKISTYGEGANNLP